MNEEMRGYGTVHRQKGSRFWWISYWKTKNGKRTRVRESSQSEQYQVARDLLAERRAEQIFPVATSPVISDSTPETVTIAELVADLIEWYASENPRPTFKKDTESRWKLHLKVAFGELKASELGTAHLRAYRTKRSQEKAAFATINRELQVIRKAFKLAAESEPPKVLRIPKFKGAIGKEKNARKVFVDPLTLKNLREAASKEGLWARVFVEMMFLFGWRKGEIEPMCVSNVRLAENTIRIEDSKNGEPREVDMPEYLRVLIQPLVIGRKPSEPLWPVRQFRYAWKRICNAAGVKAGKLEGFVMHDARRTSAKIKRAAGVSESVIMDIQGWKTSAQFRRYGIVDQADRRQALEKEQQFLTEAERRIRQAKQIEIFGLQLTEKTPQPT